jgi:hypothetical protein
MEDHPSLSMTQIADEAMSRLHKMLLCNSVNDDEIAMFSDYIRSEVMIAIYKRRIEKLQASKEPKSVLYNLGVMLKANAPHLTMHGLNGVAIAAFADSLMV